MEWIDTLGDINYIAVLISVVAGFAIGMSWYSMSMFGKTWMKELGLSEKDVNSKDGMMKAMLHSAIASFIAASVMAALMYATGTDGTLDGAVFGAVVGFGIAMSSMVTHDAFSKVNMTLTRINGAHDVVKYAVVGAIIGGVGF